MQLTTGYVMSERARHYHWQGAERLSLKTFCGGRALYASGGGSFAVDERSYLLLNADQPYSIIIDSPTIVESFCLFFNPGLAEDVAAGMTLPAQRHLDDPFKPRRALLFFDRTYPHDDTVSPLLHRLRSAYQIGRRETGWFEEQMHGVVLALLRTQSDVYTEIEALPAARPATREELYRRLHYARDFAAATFDQPLTLDELARVACLSPNHFLRSFKLLFHQTPYQYLTHLRLEEAQRLLRHTELSVTEIGQAVGFESLGSFSWLFRQRFGLSPQAYRLAKR